jgi:hypothetical protein
VRQLISLTLGNIASFSLSLPEGICWGMLPEQLHAAWCGRRKMQQIQARIQDIGDESLEEQLQMAVSNVERRAAPDFRLTRLASVSSPCVLHAMPV